MKIDYQAQHTENAPGKKHKAIWLATITVCVIVAAIGVGIVLAYFTDKVHVDTVFTFGNVEIIPEEPDYPPDDPPDTPNEETPKNPMIFNNGSEVCIVFMEVKVPIATFTLVNEDGTKGDETTTEVFWLKINELESGEDIKTDAEGNSFHDTDNGGSWILLNYTQSTTDGEYTTYLFGYQIALDGTDERVENVLNPTPDELAKLESTQALFDKVQIKNYLEGTLNGNYSIIVNSYGIQANYLDEDGNYLFGDDGVLDTANPLTKEILQKIWNIYRAQTA